MSDDLENIFMDVAVRHGKNPQLARRMAREFKEGYHETVDDVLEYPPRMLLEMRNIGKKSLVIFNHFLIDYEHDPYKWWGNHMPTWMSSYLHSHYPCKRRTTDSEDSETGCDTPHTPYYLLIREDQYEGLDMDNHLGSFLSLHNAVCRWKRCCLEEQNKKDFNPNASRVWFHILEIRPGQPVNYLLSAGSVSGEMREDYGFILDKLGY